MKNLFTFLEMNKPLEFLKILFVLSLGLLGADAFGQVANYTFLESAGTYNAIVGGTSVHPAGWDDLVATKAIGFTFNFNGIDYTNCSVNSNGFITFGTPVSLGTEHFPISTARGYLGAISAFGAHLKDPNPPRNQPIIYATTGSAPNRIFIVQWTQCKRSDEAGLIDFQIKLYETSNRIDFVYGSIIIPIKKTSINVQVGLRGSSNTDFNNRTLIDDTKYWDGNTTNGLSNISSCVSNNIIQPSSGRTFTWIPPPTITSINPSNGCAGSTLNIIGTNFTGANAVTVGGIAVTAFTVNSATSITATVGRGTTGKVKVSTAGGSSTSVTTFTINLTPRDYTIKQTVSPALSTSCTEDYVQLDILGMPDPFPFKEQFTPKDHTWTKTIYGTEPNYLGIDITSSSNSAMAGGTPFEGKFFSQNDGYNTINDWTLYPDTGVVGNYLPISLDGYSAAEFKFKSRFESKGTWGSFTRNIYVEISKDAVNWTIVWSKPSIADGAVLVDSPTFNLSAYLGAPIYLRFRYYGNGAGLLNWYLDDVIISGTVPPLIWSPPTGLYTDAALTIPYTGTDVTFLFAAPNGSQLYTLSSSISSCAKTTTSTIVHNKKKFTATLGNWSVDNNWLPVGAPLSPTYTDDRCVNVPNGKSVVVNVSNAIAKSITVDAGGKLTISSKQALKVTDAIINDAGDTNFVVQSDGNLLQINPSKLINSGNITAERSVTNIDYNPGTFIDYVYWSSPVAGQQTKGAGGFSPGTPNNRFFDYRESNDRFYETPDVTFTAGKGYAVQAETTLGTPYGKTYAFKGAPNNGDVNIALTKSADNPVGVVHGYNLIGNPYPSNIDFNELYLGNSALIYNSAWFWTNISYEPNQLGSGYGGNDYAVLNGTGGVPYTANGKVSVGQGFIVRAKANGTLTFKNSYSSGHDLRVSSSATFFQKDNAVKNRFWINLTAPSQIVNSQLIGYVLGATNDYEEDYDAEAFNNYSDLFYSILPGKRLLIQGKGAQFFVGDRVPVGANFFQNGAYTISLGNAEGVFESAQNIYLLDKQTGTITNLSKGVYAFAAVKGDTNGRFEIIYKPEVILVTDSSPKEGVVVYSDSDNFVIESPKLIAKIEVYDASGRLITVLKPNKRQGIVDASAISNGMYVLRITTIDGEVTNKKISR